MALTQAELLSLVLEEKRIYVKLEKLAQARDDRKVQINRAAADALSQADADYTAAVAAAQSRLAVISATLKDNAEWIAPA